MKYARSCAPPESMSRNFTKNQRDNISKSLKGKKQKIETIEKRKLTQLGKNPFLNKTHTANTKLILRLKMLERIKKQHGKHSVCYNPSACYIFDIINAIFNINGLHAMNGGEHSVMGYFLDFYEAELNLVIEYYEKGHYNSGSKKILKDELRKNEITNHLNCKFLIINYKDDLDSILKKVAKILKIK